jgi:hypothetical protein
MDIQGKKVLVIGGWGLVGSAVCRKLIEEKPKQIILTSLRREEALEAIDDLHKEYPALKRGYLIPWWGNIFVREALKDIPREEILGSSRYRNMVIDDIIDDLTDKVLHRSSLYRVIQQYRPDIVVDCVNSATAIAYQDIFSSSRSIVRLLRGKSTKNRRRKESDILEATEQLLCTLYVPQLIRHVQIIYRSMSLARTRIYVKIGTSGTGGMGLNIPYTHSEERPSRVLLSKSAVAGAHTLLLFLMGRTPDAPITKEVKPTAAIAWKRIGFGELRKHGKPIVLMDCPPERAIRLKGSLQLRMKGHAKPSGRTMKSVFIDTGENGLFSRGEFEAISTPGQMEFVTPEEIAYNVVFEIKAGNTGHDIINALDNATLAPTYRAGFMFNSALQAMQALERENNVDSVAFEMLGPPRLSKLLYEAYLLRQCFVDMRTVLETPPGAMSVSLTDLILNRAELRSQIISIGIPILLPDGRSLLRADTIKIPPARGESAVNITPSSIEHWAHDGWVDLRPKNMKLWHHRLKHIIHMAEELPIEETSSRSMYNREYWNNFRSIEPGKLCGWIFTFEEKGLRMKA